MQSPRRFRRSTAHLVGVLALSTVVVTACPPTTPVDPGPTTTTTTIDPANNVAPVISSFSASRPNGSSPLTTALQWTISDANGNALTCRIDVDGDGDVDRTVNNCTSQSLRTFTYTAVGTVSPGLTVSDGALEATASTTVAVTAASADQFNITVRLNGTMTPAQEAAFTDAAARWAQVIRAGLANTTLNIGANACDTGAPAYNGPVDDVLIDATITTIDGPGSVLGSAGPCWVRISNGLPLYGVMKFDVDDVVSLENAGDFSAVILHEMGHVLGFGTIWDDKGLVGAGTSNPTFNGPAARGAWNAIGGSGNVPVENSGGSGTAGSHWRESTFNGELMTGYIDHWNNPLSALTIGAFADFGYGVDLAAADSYGVPVLRSGEPDEPDLDLHVDLIRPKGAL